MQENNKLLLGVELFVAEELAIWLKSFHLGISLFCFLFPHFLSLSTSLYFLFFCFLCSFLIFTLHFLFRIFSLSLKSLNFSSNFSRQSLHFPVDTRRRFNVDTMSYDVVSTLKRRRVSTGFGIVNKARIFAFSRVS